jgi:hypothetical protein
MSLPLPQGVYTEGVMDLSLHARAQRSVSCKIRYFDCPPYHKVVPYVRLGAGDLGSGVKPVDGGIEIDLSVKRSRPEPVK